MAESQTEIFSAISSAAESAPRLRSLQEAVFSCLLSMLAGEDPQPLHARMASAARNAAAAHSVAEQISALDQLEMTILKRSRRDSADEAGAQDVVRAASFFCEARRIVTATPPRNQSGTRDGGNPTHDVRTEGPGRSGSIRLIDEVTRQMLDPSIGPDEVLKMICGGVLQMTTADAVTIHMVDRESGDFVLKQFMAGPAFREAEQKRLPEFFSEFTLIPRSSESAGRLFNAALAEKRPIFSPDVKTDSRLPAGEVMSDFGVKAMLVVPMFESGKEFGFMSVILASAHPFAPLEVESLNLFADQAAVAWRNAELYQELLRSEQRYRDLIENAIDIIFVLDTEGRFVSINRRAEQITGFKVEDWVGRHFSELVNPEDLPAVMEGWSGGLKGGSNILPLRMRNARGEDVHLKINSAPIEEAGELKGLMCIARDATAETEREEEFKKLHESVVEANRRLEESVVRLKATQAKLIQTEKLSAMGELISGVAHELNNPLTGIMGYSQLLIESLSDSRHRRSLERINHEALRCKRIVQNLLGFARGHKPRKQLSDVNAVIQSVIDLREYQIRSDGIRLVMRLDGRRPQVLGDFHHLQQVILNILNNAHQAIVASKTGEKIEVKSETDEHRARLRIVISDDGPGISSEDLPRIFDPFFTTKEVGQGTGLGLSVAYGIVQEHGGHISVENSQPRGAAFQIELPLAGCHSEAADDDLKEPDESGKHSKRGRALVVDDEEVIVDLLADILVQMGLAVERAHNGEEALRKIATTDIDFIICDLKMPGMDGKTLYFKIRELNPELSRKMIFSTGDTLSADFRAFCAGADCTVVEKPFLIEDLMKAIAALDSG